MPRIHWIFRHLTFIVFFPHLKSDLRGKQFSDLYEQRTESDLKREMVWLYLRKMGSTTQEMRKTPGIVF